MRSPSPNYYCTKGHRYNFKHFLENPIIAMTLGLYKPLVTASKIL